MATHLSAYMEKENKKNYKSVSLIYMLVGVKFVKVSSAVSLLALDLLPRIVTKAITYFLVLLDMMHLYLM